MKSPHSLLRGRLTRVVRLVLVASVAVGSAMFALADSGAPAGATAGSPGVPGNGTVLFVENFENNGSTTIDPPVLITDYVGATGQTYSASPFWMSSSQCNGMILAATSAPVAPGSMCSGDYPTWALLKELAGKLSAQFGAAGDQFTVASYTTGSDGVGPADYLQAETETPIPLPSGSAYVTVAVDAAANSCQAPGPSYWLYAVDASNNKKAVVSAGVNPCLDPDAIVDTTGSATARLAHTAGNSPALITTPTVRMVLENHNVGTPGNDATFDNLQLIDVSPQLDKSFTSPVALGSTSTMTFTITNTYSPDGAGVYNRLDPKPGWSFTDRLPYGLSIVGAVTTGSGATACANLNTAGTTAGSLSVTGDLIAGQVYCTVSAEVKAVAPGDYTNLASDVQGVGLQPPANASVTFVANPGISLTKSSKVNDTNTNGITDLGDTISYSFVATNTGDVPLINAAITDAKAGTVTCSPTTIPVGGSVPCTATNPYAMTQADIDAGKVDNSASVTGANAFDPTKTVSADASTSTPVSPAPRLELTKHAGTPSDKNASGLTDAGDTIAYTFTVKNTGNVSMNGFRIDDPLVGSVTCPNVTLTPTQTTTCTADAEFTITDAHEIAKQVNNTATAYGSTPAGTEVPSNTSSTSTPVSTPRPSLMIDKTADAPNDKNSSGLVDAGDTIQYRFTVTNNGNVPITGVTVNDPLVGAVTCLATSLAVNASTTCTATALYTITALNQSAGVAVNTATATGKDPDNNPVVSPADETSTPVATPHPSLLFEKTAVVTDANASGLTDATDTIQYSFVVTNNGDVPITGITVTDDKVAGAITCVATSLAVKASTTCTAGSLYVVTKADEISGVVTNTASASGVAPDGGSVKSNSDSTTTPIRIPVPKLTIDKTADTPTDTNRSLLVDAGDTVQYRFVVTNEGNVPLTAIAVDDPLVGRVTCSATSLLPGAATNCKADAVYVITKADETTGAVKNTAAASGLDPNKAPVSSPPDHTITPVATPKPSLVIAKFAGAPTDVNASGLTDAGDKIRFSFKVTNNGNVPMSGVTVNDAMVGAVTCAATSLAPGQATDCVAKVDYVITQADQTARAVSNQASASGLDPNGAKVVSNVDKTSTPVVTPRPSLLFDKIADAPIDANSSGLTDAGDTIQYRFTVTNNGDVPLSKIVVNDPLVGPVTCLETQLAPGRSTRCVADRKYVLTQADETKGLVMNTASATGADPNGAPVKSNDDTTSTRTDLPYPHMYMVKSAVNASGSPTSGPFHPGESIGYTFTVTNDGNIAIRDLRITDPKIGAVTCPTITLQPRASVTCTSDAPYVVTGDDLAAGQVVNHATANANAPSGAKLTPLAATSDVTVKIESPVPNLPKTGAAALRVLSAALILFGGGLVLLTLTRRRGWNL